MWAFPHLPGCLDSSAHGFMARVRGDPPGERILPGKENEQGLALRLTLARRLDVLEGVLARCYQASISFSVSTQRPIRSSDWTEACCHSNALRTFRKGTTEEKRTERIENRESSPPLRTKLILYSVLRFVSFPKAEQRTGSPRVSVSWLF